MELFVYKGEFKLPSIDFDCLRVLTYCKLAEIDVKINTSANPFHSNNGFLPYLTDEGRQYSGYERIINYLQDGKNYTLISSAPQLSYLRENLYPFFMYQLFGNPQNIDETRTLYATRTPFPFNFYYPSKYVRKADEVCQAIGNFSLEEPHDAHDTSEMSLKAKKCLNWLSEKLGNHEFFLNGVPSEVDATVYAYLAVILRYQLTNNILQGHAKQCENLVKYVNNITTKFFKESEVFESPSVKAKATKQEQKVFTGNEDEDPPAMVRRRYILSGLFATTAMISYAFLAGIFSIATADASDVNSFTFDNNVDDDE